MKIFQIALAVMLAAGACGTAHAQLTLNGQRLTLDRGEAAALTNLRNTIDGHDPKLQDNALAAARRVLSSVDGHYVFALYEDEIAKQRNDDTLRAEALDVLIASTMTPADRLPSYLSMRGYIAFQRKDFATADTLWSRRVALTPGDAASIANLAQVRVAQNDAKGAADLLEQAVAARTATHQPVSESLYRQIMTVAYEGGLKDKAIAAAHALVRTYPSPANWRDAMVVYRQLTQAQGPLEIDLFRLMRATVTLTQDSEYQRLAQLLEHAGAPAEAKAVIDEGVSRSLLDPLEPHTHAIADEIDRRLAQPVPAIADTGPAAELHAAVKLAQAGQREPAKAAFARLAAQPGAYADLAIFWLDWVSQQH